LGGGWRMDEMERDWSGNGCLKEADGNFGNWTLLDIHGTYICLVEILQLDKPNIRVLFVSFHQYLIMVFRHASSCTTL
jgi:hypothetical protein